MEINLKKPSIAGLAATIVTLTTIGILVWDIVHLFLMRGMIVQGAFHFYSVSDLCFLVAAVLLMFSAMLWSNAGFVWASRSAMIAGGIFLGLVLTDQYI